MDTEKAEGGTVQTTERRQTSRGRRESDFQRERELEMLMTERENLLRSTGAAAIFVAKLDSHTLPEATYEAADILAATINGLPEETLRDAIDLVREQLGESLGDDDEEEK